MLLLVSAARADCKDTQHLGYELCPLIKDELMDSVAHRMVSFGISDVGPFHWTGHLNTC